MRLNPSLSPHDKWVTDPIARSLPSAYLCHCKRGNSNSCVQTSTKVSGSIDFGTTTNRYRFWVRTPMWKGPAPREANFGPDVYVHSNWRTAVKFGVIKPSRRCEGYCVSTICLPVPKAFAPPGISLSCWRRGCRCGIYGSNKCPATYKVLHKSGADAGFVTQVCATTVK